MASRAPSTRTTTSPGTIRSTAESRFASGRVLRSASRVRTSPNPSPPASRRRCRIRSSSTSRVWPAAYGKGLTRREIGLHVQGQYWWFLGETFLLRATWGPTVFIARQESGLRDRHPRNRHRFRSGPADEPPGEDGHRRQPRRQPRRRRKLVPDRAPGSRVPRAVQPRDGYRAARPPGARAPGAGRHADRRGSAGGVVKRLPATRVLRGGCNPAPGGPAIDVAGRRYDPGASTARASRSDSQRGGIPCNGGSRCSR